MLLPTRSPRNRTNNVMFLGAGIEKKYGFPDLKDSGVPDRMSPSYTKIHVDKDTGPDYCYTAIGIKGNVFSTLQFINILNEVK